MTMYLIDLGPGLVGPFVTRQAAEEWAHWAIGEHGAGAVFAYNVVTVFSPIDGLDLVRRHAGA